CPPNGLRAYGGECHVKGKPRKGGRGAPGVQYFLCPPRWPLAHSVAFSEEVPHPPLATGFRRSRPGQPPPTSRVSDANRTIQPTGPAPAPSSETNTVPAYRHPSKSRQLLAGCSTAFCPTPSASQSPRYFPHAPLRPPLPAAN